MPEFRPYTKARMDGEPDPTGTASYDADTIISAILGTQGVPDTPENRYRAGEMASQLMLRAETDQLGATSTPTTGDNPPRVPTGTSSVVPPVPTSEGTPSVESVVGSGGSDDPLSTGTGGANRGPRNTAPVTPATQDEDGGMSLNDMMTWLGIPLTGMYAATAGGRPPSNGGGGGARGRDVGGTVPPFDPTTGRPMLGGPDTFLGLPAPDAFSAIEDGRSTPGMLPDGREQPPATIPSPQNMSTIPGAQIITTPQGQAVRLGNGNTIPLEEFERVMGSGLSRALRGL